MKVQSEVGDAPSTARQSPHHRNSHLGAWSREWHGFWKPAGKCHGFTWGTGTGWEFLTRRKPVPVAGVDGFDPVWNSARKRERLPAQHSTMGISGYHNHQLPQKHEQGEEMGGASTISSKGMLSISSIYANLKLYRIPCCSNFPTPHHPRKRARVLDFDGDWLFFTTTKQPPSKTSTRVLIFEGSWLFFTTTKQPPTKTSMACLFCMVVACLTLAPS